MWGCGRGVLCAQLPQIHCGGINSNWEKSASMEWPIAYGCFQTGHSARPCRWLRPKRCEAGLTTILWPKLSSHSPKKYLRTWASRMDRMKKITSIINHHEDHAPHQKITAIIKFRRLLLNSAVILCNKIQNKHACCLMSCLWETIKGTW